MDIGSVGFTPTRNTFAVRVRGVSMIGRHILDGDVVVLERGPDPRHGQVVAALVDGERTLKTYVVKNGKPYLKAENPKYPDLIPAQELVIQGRVQGADSKSPGVSHVCQYCQRPCRTARLANPTNVAGMARFGIVGKKLLGISVVQFRAIAKRIGRDHELAEALWASGIFEARILAAFVAEPGRVTRRQANAWAKDFECWADCDGLCIHLFRKTPFCPRTGGCLEPPPGGIGQARRVYDDGHAGRA